MLSDTEAGALVSVAALCLLLKAYVSARDRLNSKRATSICTATPRAADHGIIPPTLPEPEGTEASWLPVMEAPKVPRVDERSRRSLHDRSTAPRKAPNDHAHGDIPDDSPGDDRDHDRENVDDELGIDEEDPEVDEQDPDADEQDPAVDEQDPDEDQQGVDSCSDASGGLPDAREEDRSVANSVNETVLLPPRAGRTSGGESVFVLKRVCNAMGRPPAASSSAGYERVQNDSGEPAGEEVGYIARMKRAAKVTQWVRPDRIASKAVELHYKSFAADIENANLANELE
jgi:hypothetical protein